MGALLGRIVMERKWKLSPVVSTSPLTIIFPTSSRVDGVSERDCLCLLDSQWISDQVGRGHRGQLFSLGS